MTDIDWENAPDGATHYQKEEGDYLEGWLRGDGDYADFMPADDEEWIPGSYVETNAIPRPAKHRDWSDPAMWFDAPDWAKNVIAWGDQICYGNNLEGKFELVGGGQFETPTNGPWRIIATRPTDSKPETVADETKPDNVNHPQHYTQGGIECIDAIKAALTPEEFRGYCKGNALKYVWRELHKGGNESLEKAQWYLAKAVQSANQS